MFPTFHLIEYAEGFELPDELHAHPAVVELKRLASRLVGMGNDLGGLAKDIRNRWLNLVLVDAERSALPIADAFARVVAIHNHDVRAFDRRAAQLVRGLAEISNPDPDSRDDAECRARSQPHLCTAQSHPARQRRDR